MSGVQERLRSALARCYAGLVGLTSLAATGRLVLQIVRGAAGNHNFVLTFGPGCVDWFVTPGTEAVLVELEDGQLAALGLQSTLGAAVPPLPGQARFFNPATGRAVLLDADGIVRLGGPAALRPIAAVGDTVTFAPGAISVTAPDGTISTNAAAAIGTITTGSAGSMAE